MVETGEECAEQAQRDDHEDRLADALTRRQQAYMPTQPIPRGFPVRDEAKGDHNVARGRHAHAPKSTFSHQHTSSALLSEAYTPDVTAV